MATFRKKLYVVLTFGFMCAFLIFVFGIREGMYSAYLRGEPLLIQEDVLSPQPSDDTGQQVIRLELSEPSPPPFRLNDDPVLNIRKEDIIQLALPLNNELKLTARELLDQTMLHISDELIPSSKSKNSSFDILSILGVWHDWRPILNRSDISLESMNAMQEGLLFWGELMKAILDEIKQDEQRVAQLAAPSPNHALSPMAYAPAVDDLSKLCPYSVSELNSTELLRDDFVLEVPCGLVVDSSITFVGIPRGFMGDFKINLLGERLPGEHSPSIILHYNVRLHGDLLTNTSVIVQNTWTLAHDWQEEERCPPIEEPENVTTVDNLSKCLDQVGKPVAGRGGGLKWPGRPSKDKLWFPFMEGFPFAATLRVGVEGFHMTVNGRHITSFEYRQAGLLQNIEPWLVSGVEAKGDLQLSSMMVNGLPYVEEVDRVTDLEFLKAPPLPADGNLSMLIGVFSTSNNFDRRMAIRRSWMQAKEVRSGKVAVRFFVGLHKTKQVNRELWNEATTYGDVQLMPFVDYYYLITLKTLAVCILATTDVKAEFVMKTDDDTFVRVDEVLSLVTAVKTPNSLLYGKMEFEAIPHRSRDDKWFVSEEEYAQPKYPPWAHGPGYIISQDIANFVVQRHKHKQLQIFKLEDVAMGIWIDKFRNTTGTHVDYINNDNFIHTGCSDGFVIAHYRSPRQMLCMWEKIAHGTPNCC